MSKNIIKEILQEYAKQQQLSFEDFYKTCCKAFSNISSYFQIRASNYDDIKKKWPKGVGVYAVWEAKANLKDVLVYIGMTGKIKKYSDGKTKLFDSKNGFSQRAGRTHPYSFTQSGAYKDFFEYGPKHALANIKKAASENRYTSRIPIKNIRIDCFQISEQMNLAPSLLEGLLLQDYFNTYSKLPDANNEL